MAAEQKIGFEQKLSQTLSARQIQFTQLLQLSDVEMSGRIQSEMEKNPVLEEDKGPAAQEGGEGTSKDGGAEEEASWEEALLSSRSLGDTHPVAGKAETRSTYSSLENRISSKQSLFERLEAQLNLLNFGAKERMIGEYLIGSLDDHGYMRRALPSVVDDLFVVHHLLVSVQEVERVLRELQEFDPPGILATNLQECLCMQLRARMEKNPQSAVHREALRILEEAFAAFSQKKYVDILSSVPVHRQAATREAMALITRLNPKPADVRGSLLHPAYLIPDFLVRCEAGSLRVSLSKAYAPQLRISPFYQDMVEKKTKTSTDKEAVSYVKKQIAAARWFVGALVQRERTLRNTMQVIVDRQRAFFMEGEPYLLAPMVLKDVAEEVGVNVSTISRIVSNKSAQTGYGVFPLKYFFNKSVQTDEGAVSNKVVQECIREIIKKEDKKKPFSDRKIALLMKERGYPIARRTVAKYREKTKMPAARLRKMW